MSTITLRANVISSANIFRAKASETLGSVFILFTFYCLLSFDFAGAKTKASVASYSGWSSKGLELVSDSCRIRIKLRLCHANNRRGARGSKRIRRIP
jgi:hypothetical protein